MKVSKIALCVAFAMMAVGQCAWGMKGRVQWTLYSADDEGNPGDLYVVEYGSGEDRWYEPLIGPNNGVALAAAGGRVPVEPDESGFKAMLKDVEKNAQKLKKFEDLITNIIGPFTYWPENNILDLYLTEIESLEPDVPSTLGFMKMTAISFERLFEAVGTEKTVGGKVTFSVGANIYTFQETFWKNLKQSTPWKAVEAKGQVPQPQPTPPQKLEDKLAAIQNQYYVKDDKQTQTYGWVPYSPGQGFAVVREFTYNGDAALGAFIESNKTIQMTLDAAGFQEDVIGEMMIGAQASLARKNNTKFNLSVKELSEKDIAPFYGMQGAKSIGIDNLMKATEGEVTIDNKLYKFEPLFWKALKASKIMEGYEAAPTPPKKPEKKPKPPKEEPTPGSIEAVLNGFAQALQALADNIKK